MALTASVTDTRRGINGLVSTRWVFLWVVDVPAHAKNGITGRQTGALRSDGRTPSHLAAQDGDKWRTLPAECTHISNSITLSQHANSRCQSGSHIYANTRKSANTGVRGHTVTCLLLHQGFMHSSTPGVLPLLCALLPLCCDSIMTLDWQKNLYDGGSATSPTATISIKSKRCTDFER